MKKQAGFTLIELVVVIVILGILAAVAVPKFINLSAEADAAATKGVAGAAASATAINYGAYSANTAKGTDPTTLACTSASIGGLMDNGVPSGYAISGTAPNCIVTGPKGSTASFVISGHP